MFTLLERSFQAFDSYGVGDTFSGIGPLLGAFINILLGISFSFAVVSMGYSAFLYAMSAGDPKATKAAFNTFIWGAIAVAITLAALALKTIFVSQIVGVQNPDIVNPLPSF